MSDVLEYVERKGWEYRLEGDEIVCKVCPICHNDNFNFYLNKNSGMYHCWICEATHPNGKGHIASLKEYIGDVVPVTKIVESKEEDPNFSELAESYHEELLRSRKVYKYLIERGISIDVINEFKIGTTTKLGETVISIPSSEDGIVKLIKFRLLKSNGSSTLPKYSRKKGSKSILFNSDILNDDNIREVVLTEGEIDALTLLSNGFKNVIGNTGGATTFLTDWYDKLSRLEHIYVCYDQDESGVGQKGAEIVASRLKQRVRNVVLPKGVNDINDFFVKYGGTREQFLDLMADAKQFDIPGIVTIEDALEYVYKAALSGKDTVLPTPWNSVNKLLKGGLRCKNLMVIGAPPKIGKTHWCLQLSFWLAKTQNIPVLFFCMEMSFEELAMLVVCMNEEIYEYEYNPMDAGMYADNLQGIPLYLGYNANISMQQLEETIREATARFGLGLAIFDNLTWLVRGAKDITAATGDATKSFKNLAMELDIPIIVVAQPRKLKGNTPMNYWDFKDSAAIPADADILCVMHRKRLDEVAFSENVLFRVDAGRFTAGGSTELRFLGPQHIMVESE